MRRSRDVPLTITIAAALAIVGCEGDVYYNTQDDYDELPAISTTAPPLWATRYYRYDPVHIRWVYVNYVDPGLPASGGVVVTAPKTFRVPKPAPPASSSSSSFFSGGGSSFSGGTSVAPRSGSSSIRGGFGGIGGGSVS